MNSNMKPSTIMLLAGGAVLFISSFLDWRTNFGGLETDITGLQGIFCLLIGGAVAVLTALTAFGNVNLPDRVLGFSWNQIFLMLGFAAFLMTFALQFADFTEFGVTLAWIASAVIVAGAFMEIQGEGRGSGASGMPPTTF